ncbi:MAG: type II toxin-antitoxin system VapC family toxin [Candidatus Binatia bacterium]
MLDTNTVSYYIRGHKAVERRLESLPMASLCISAITAGELFFGLEKQPAATRLRYGVFEFLRRIDVYDWDLATAERYGAVRADLRRQGKALGLHDLQIAAHALRLGAILVTSDTAFQHVAELRIEDWTANRE